MIKVVDMRTEYEWKGGHMFFDHVQRGVVCFLVCRWGGRMFLGPVRPKSPAPPPPALIMNLPLLQRKRYLEMQKADDPNPQNVTDVCHILTYRIRHDKRPRHLQNYSDR